MAIIVKLKHLRISPRKVRLIAETIRGKTVEQAENQLQFSVRKATEPLRKLLKSAVATAENDLGKEKSNLYVSKIMVDKAPTLKRSRPRARGRIFPIMKRSSHITLVLEEINPNQKTKKKEVVGKAGEEIREEEKKPVKETKKQERFGAKARVKTKPSFKRIFKRKAF